MSNAKQAWKAARFATKALIAIAIFLVLFVAVMVWSFIVTGGEEQSQLIDSVFTVVGIECGALMLKRVMEIFLPRRDKNGEP